MEIDIEAFEQKWKITKNDSNANSVNGTNGMVSNGNIPKPSSNGNIPKANAPNLYNGANLSLTKRENGVGLKQQPENSNGLAQLPKPPQIPPRTRPPLPLPPTSPPKLEIPIRIASQSMRSKQLQSSSGGSHYGTFSSTNPFDTNGNCDYEIKQIEANDRINPCKTGAYPKIKTAPTAQSPPRPTSPTATPITSPIVSPTPSSSANIFTVDIPIRPSPSKYLLSFIEFCVVLGDITLHVSLNRRIKSIV